MLRYEYETYEWKGLKYYSISFPVDTVILERHFLEGKTFDDCYKEDRLFYINYKDLEEYVAKASNAVSFITLLGTVLAWLRPNKCDGQLLTLFRMGIFLAAHGWGAKRPPP